MNTGSITKILLIKVAIPTDDIEETKKNQRNEGFMRMIELIFKEQLERKIIQLDVKKKVEVLTCFMISHISFAETWFSPERPNTCKTVTFTF
jgi:hypothetical protein